MGLPHDPRPVRMKVFQTDEPLSIVMHTNKHGIQMEIMNSSRLLFYAYFIEDFMGRYDL